MREPLEFREPGGGGASIWISPRAAGSILGASFEAGRRETGGILVGRYGPSGWSADVVEATPRPRRSRSGFSWFVRSNHGLAALLEERWPQGLHYLGEWHFHPGGSPEPSPSDVRAMLRVSRDEAYGCPAPLLAILGGWSWTDWSMSVTLFREDSAVPLRRVSS